MHFLSQPNKMLMTLGQACMCYGYWARCWDYKAKGNWKHKEWTKDIEYFTYLEISSKTDS